MPRHVTCSECGHEFVVAHVTDDESVKCAYCGCLTPNEGSTGDSHREPPPVRSLNVGPDGRVIDEVEGTAFDRVSDKIDGWADRYCGIAAMVLLVVVVILLAWTVSYRRIVSLSEGGCRVCGNPKAKKVDYRVTVQSSYGMRRTYTEDYLYCSTHNAPKSIGPIRSFVSGIMKLIAFLSPAIVGVSLFFVLINTKNGRYLLAWSAALLVAALILNHFRAKPVYLSPVTIAFVPFVAGTAVFYVLHIWAQRRSDMFG